MNPYQPYQPRRSRPSHRVRNSIILAVSGAVALLVVLAVIGAALGAGHPRSRHHTACCASPVSPASAPSATAAANSIVRKVVRVWFRVTGTGSPQITYGTDTIQDSPANGGSVPLPWRAYLRYSPNAMYWYVNAQLQGAGQITCAVGLKVTGYFADGTHASKSRVLATGHASGGFNICEAQSS